LIENAIMNTTAHTTAMTPLTAFSASVADNSDQAMQRLRRRGLMLLLAGLGGFVLWSATMPIDEALAGSGMLGAATQRKAVQPALDGVLASMAVREGERVAAGQVLMSLDVGAQRVELASTQRQLVLADASRVRLAALLAGADSLVFSEAIVAQASAINAQPLLADQQALFVSQRQAVMGERSQYASQTVQMQIEAAKLSDQAVQQRAQRQLSETQVGSLSELVKMGFYSRVRLADTERQLGDARMNETRMSADATRTQQQLTGMRAERSRRDAEQRSAWESERLDLERLHEQLTARIASLETTIGQAAVVAPVAGTVVGLNVHAAGAVVHAAQTLMEIVPANDELLVDARFPLASGEKLGTGMDADLRMVTLDQASTPVVKGTVLTVSADRVEDARTGEPYLRVQIAIPAAEQARLAHEGVKLRPGLQAEAHVRLGERTLLGHLLKPVTDRLAHAFTS
jgi:protease secretion system membrane fusion protein